MQKISLRMRNVGGSIARVSLKVASRVAPGLCIPQALPFLFHDMGRLTQPHPTFNQSKIINRGNSRPLLSGATGENSQKTKWNCELENCVRVIFREAQFTLQEHHLLVWVVACCSLFVAYLTWSAAPQTVTSGSIGRKWPPRAVQAPRAIGATGTQRAHGSKQAPSTGWCWAAHYALLRAGAEDGSWKGHDHGWWVDDSFRITAGRNTGLVPGICNWLGAGHLAGCKAAGAGNLPIGRHLLGTEVDLKHTTVRHAGLEAQIQIECRWCFKEKE